MEILNGLKRGRKDIPKRNTLAILPISRDVVAVSGIQSFTSLPGGKVARERRYPSSD